MPSSPRDKRLELVLQSMEALPTLPAVAMRVLSAVSNRNTSAAELTRIISSDAPLSARLLQLTRRADTVVRSENADLGKAVVLLGFEAVRAAVLAVAVFDSFRGPAASANSSGFDRAQFWKHSIAVGCCAELLAKISPAEATGRQSRVEPADAFAGGLLHDLGKIALDAILPKSFARVVEATDMLRGNIADLELRVVGLDHMVVGKRLAERWNLPAVLRDCIWLHGQDPSALPNHVASARLVNLVTLADVLVRQQHLGYSGNYTMPASNEPLLAAVGLTGTQILDALTHLVDEIESRCAALGLGESTSGELYRQAITRANEELGAAHQQLANKSRQVASRKKFFDALTDFQNEIRPDALVGGVMTAIAQTAANVLEASGVAVFSLQPGGTFASVVIADVSGNFQDTLLVDVPADFAPTLSDGSPIRSAGNELEWLTAAVSPKLPGARWFYIALAGDHQTIGGVLWGAQGDELQRLEIQRQELSALSGGWGLALRVAQIREDSQSMAEQLADSNRRLQAMQEELLRSRMLISVGEMAAGAAHEMNNPLAVISGRSQLLASQLADPRQRAAAKLIHEQSDRLSSIITELMDFAQPPRPTLSRCDISEVIRDAIAEAQVLTKEGIDSADRTVEVIVTDVPSVTIDSTQVRQALAELIANALQATGMATGAAPEKDRAVGRVTVRIGHDSFSRRVVIDVTDDGCGMSRETLRRAFDPFFSALPAGRRRGMGLPKALRWVEGSGGSIRLESEPKRGTRAIVLLPAAADSIGQQLANPPSSPEFGSSELGSAKFGKPIVLPA